MKSASLKTFAAAALFSTLLAGCQAEMETPDLKVPAATWERTVTIAELKDAFYNSADNYATLVGDKDENGTHYVIKARISSSDASGNIYQTLYLQDETGAIPVSVRMNSYYTTYRLGQEILMDLTGMYVGKYAGLMQIGGYGMYNGNPQTDRTAEEVFKAHVQLNGLPDPSTVNVTYGSDFPENTLYYVTFNGLQNFPSGSNATAAKEMGGQLVEIRNVYFTDPGDTFSSYESSGENRTITDGTNELVVRTSGYANFYADLIPEGIGTVRGELGIYNGTWQLTLRSRYDCIFGDQGTEESPYSVEAALMQVNDGTEAWVEGYIVGAINDGVSEVTSNKNIDWGNVTDENTNVVIASSVNCRDYTQCMAVSLPQGSELRAQANLVDHPENYGKTLKVYGRFGIDANMGALLDCPGTSADFSLTGESADPNDVPEVVGEKGTWDNPVTVTELLAGFSGSGKWFTGYIVGWVDTTTADGNKFTALSSTFTAPATLATNILMAATPDEKDYTKCVPVQLPSGSVRTALNLQNNPANLGKEVTVLADVEKYFGVDAALKNASKYNWGPKGIEEVPAGATLLNVTFADGSAGGFTFTKADGKDIWTVDTQYKCLKATGYISGSRYASDVWAVSPVVDLTKASAPTMSFDWCGNYFTTQENFKAHIKVCARVSGTTDWTELTVPTWPAGNAFSFVNSGEISLAAFAGKKIEIGLNYTSGGTNADTGTLELQNLIIK